MSTKLSGGFKMIDPKRSISASHGDIVKSRSESKSVSLRSGEFGFDRDSVKLESEDLPDFD